MALAPIKYVTTSSGEWGVGEGAPLTPADVDRNFHGVLQRIDAAAAAVGSPVGIASILVSGNQLSVTLTDASVEGPFTLPKATFRYRGVFTDAEAYGVYDVVKVVDDGLYLVLAAHTAATPFDAELLVGGSAAYQLIMPAAEQAVRQEQDVPGATYTPDLTDANKLLVCSNSGGCTVTIPPDVFDANAELYFVQAGAGVVTFAPGAGVSFADKPKCELYTDGVGAVVWFKRTLTTNVFRRAGEFEPTGTA